MYDSYMKLDGIDGESTDAAHAKWSDLYSFGFGIANPPSFGSSTGSLTAGKASFSSFSVVKKFDSASVKLASAVAQGTHIAKCTVDLCLTIKGEKKTYIQYVFEKCMLESIQWDGGSNGDDRPTERLSIAYAKATWKYLPMGHDGAAGSAVGPEGWDVTTNAKV